MTHSPPPLDGVAASRVQLPQAGWATVVDGLCALFPKISRARWLDRVARGRVLDAAANPIVATTAYRAGAIVHYYREVAGEARIAATERVLYADAHLLVVDKPHRLPVLPSGRFVAETLLARLLRRSGNAELTPLHRIDRDTAGLVMFSANARTRAAYHALFRERRIGKRYEALAAPMPARSFPLTRHSRLLRGEPFIRMHEAAGIANSETRIDVIERGTHRWRYALEPVSGRKHQLRVHMAALGAPICNDSLYPEPRETPAGDRDPPLQLLAKTLTFIDPLDGRPRRFDSRFALEDSL